MGNGIGKLSVCFTGGGAGAYEARRRKDLAAVISDPLDDLGHSFCYVRPDPTRLSSSKVHSEETSSSTTTFKSISGASVSANTSTPLSTALVDLYSYNSIDRASSAAAFESSNSFASIPLQPIPRNFSINSGPLSTSGLIPSSGPIERGFMSGPIERGFMSGPLDRGLFSGPLEKGSSDQFQRSFSHGGFAFRRRSRKGSLIRALQRALSKTINRGQNSIVAPIKSVVSVKESDWITGSEKQNELTISSVNFSSEGSLDDDDSLGSQNLQWAQGKAGEDRVHVVVSEENGWVFVGIYDGFNGPDAPDYLLSNLYSAVHKELKGLLWDDKFDSTNNSSSAAVENLNFGMEDPDRSGSEEASRDRTKDGCSRGLEQETYPGSEEINFDSRFSKRNRKNSRSKYRGVTKKWEENHKKWRCEFDRERLELDQRLKEQLNRNSSNGSVNHSDVLKALSQALKKTEEAYLDHADKMVVENPELALMGSCVLVMLMKGEDVYVMNVGDSRAVLAQTKQPDLWSQDLERINEETLHDLEVFDCDRNAMPSLTAFQLSVDHSTSVEEVNTILCLLIHFDYIDRCYNYT